MEPICFGCKHYLASIPDGEYICRAFPRGIPSAIMVGEADHRQPVKGDNGIRFEARTGEDDAGTAVPE